MLLFEEEIEAETAAEEKVEEAVEEEEEGGELVLEQLKLLVNVTKTWQRILLGIEPVDAIKTLLQPAVKPVSKKVTTKAGKTTRKKSKTGKSKSKRG